MAARIMIIGCSGAGKSTLSYQIQQITGLPLYHLDRFYWKPGWIPVEENEWIEVNQKLISKDQWIIDGNYGSTMDMRLKRADTIIFMDRNTVLCLYRVIKRWLFGKREDITTGCNEKIDLQFLHYVLMYNMTRRPSILSKLKPLTEINNVYIIRNSADIKSLLDYLRDNP